MRFGVASLMCLALGLTALPSLCRAGDFPEPSPYPISWELKFEYSKPKRIVVQLPGPGPKAFWYITYSVMNDTSSSLFASNGR